MKRARRIEDILKLCVSEILYSDSGCQDYMWLIKNKFADSLCYIFYSTVTELKNKQQTPVLWFYHKCSAEIKYSTI